MSNGRRYKRQQRQFIIDTTRRNARKRGCTCGCAVRLVDDNGAVIPTVFHKEHCALVETGVVK